MTEADLKDQLVKAIRNELKSAVVLRHEDKNTAGIPDISVTWKGKTVWIEVKYARPHLIGRGLQKLTCYRLAKEGICWYVVYQEVGNGSARRTLLVQPEDVVKDKIEVIPDECMAAGFNHDFVIHFIRRICGDYH